MTDNDEQSDGLQIERHPDGVRVGIWFDGCGAQTVLTAEEATERAAQLMRLANVMTGPAAAVSEDLYGGSRFKWMVTGRGPMVWYQTERLAQAEADRRNGKEASNADR